MKNLEPKKICFKTTVGVWKSFKLECVRRDVSQKDALIELMCLFNKGKVKLPQEGRKWIAKD